MPMHLYIFIGVCLIIFYLYVNHVPTSTGSAFSQMLAGECRFDCRQDRSSGKPGAERCICDTCPCVLVENAIKSGGPVARLCSVIASSLAQPGRRTPLVKAGTGSEENFFLDGRREGNSDASSTKRLNDGKIDGATKPIDLNSSSTFIKELPQQRQNGKEVEKTVKPTNEEIKLKAEPESKSVEVEKPQSTKDTSKNSDGCPSCKKHDKICLSECPNAKK